MAWCGRRCISERRVSVGCVVSPNNSQAGAPQMARLTQRIKMHLLLAIVCCTNMGCYFLPEASFKLASDSRLPKLVTLPPGLTRANVSLELNYYSMPWGGRARFILRDKNGQVIKKEDGKTCTEPFQLKNPPQGLPPGYPSYEAITVNGITEIIEHKKMEPIFYVTDDTAVWKQYKSIGCR
jgi:hypothetical protein